MDVLNRRMFNRNARNRLSNMGGLPSVKKFRVGGDVGMEDLKYIRDLIQREVIERGLPQTYIDALEIVKDSKQGWKFQIPLDFPVYQRRFQNILYSSFFSLYNATFNKIRYPIRSDTVSSVLSLIPLFCIRINLSSILAHRESIGEPDENTFDGFVALSPYALFLDIKRSFISFVTFIIKSSVVICIKLNFHKDTKKRLQKVALI